LDFEECYSTHEVEPRVTDQKPTQETAAISSEGMLSIARSRLRSALELLGSGSEETVTDDVLTGAAVLAEEARTTLHGLRRRRASTS